MGDTLYAALDRGRARIDAEGSARERLYLAVLFGEADTSALCAACAERQAPDGALPRLGGSAPADFESTLETLVRLGPLGLLDRAPAETAGGVLIEAQCPDGAFGDASLGADERLALTGAVGGVLAQSPFTRASVLHGIEAFMSAQWSVERVQGPSYAPILAYFHWLASWSSEIADEALQWCGRELERGFRMGLFPAHQVARVFLRAGATSLPGASIDAGEVVDALVGQQAEDGSWGSRGDSLDALTALMRLSV